MFNNHTTIQFSKMVFLNYPFSLWGQNKHICILFKKVLCPTIIVYLILANMIYVRLKKKKETLNTTKAVVLLI